MQISPCGEIRIPELAADFFAGDLFFGILCWYYILKLISYACYNYAHNLLRCAFY
jgi:hypothetical protein